MVNDEEYDYIREKIWVQMELEYKQNFELQTEEQKPAKIQLEYEGNRMGKVSTVAEKGIHS